MLFFKHSEIRFRRGDSRIARNTSQGRSAIARGRPQVSPTNKIRMNREKTKIFAIPIDISYYTDYNIKVNFTGY